MKYFGAIIVVLYAVVAFSGWEPFTREERGVVATRGGGVRFWTGGFMGGK
jgi:hypothetical protein